jgi:hypothetical protein
MQAYPPAPKVWTDGSVAAIAEPTREVRPGALLASELREALASTAQRGAGLGDAFLFGRIAAPYERAIEAELPADARVFACIEGSSHVVRGRTRVQAAELDDRMVQRLRARHQVRRVSAVVVADDFAWSLGRVAHSLRSLLGAHAALLVAGRQAALLETLWLDELRRDQRDFDVERMPTPASIWARFALRRRQYV